MRKGLRYNKEFGRNLIGCISLSATTFMVIIAFVVCVLFGGCRTQKEMERTRDSVRIEYREKVVKVPVKVYVEVPVEKEQITTDDTTSTLSTSFAISTASIIFSGSKPSLFHSLENIPQKIEKSDSVAVKEVEKTVYKTRRVTYTKTVYMNGEMYWYQEIFYYLGIASFVIIMVYLVYLCKIKLWR